MTGALQRAAGETAPAAGGVRLVPSHRAGDRRVAVGCDLFGPEAPAGALFNLLWGWVALYALLPDGTRQIVEFALPGAVLAVPGPEGGATGFGALALTDALVSAIPGERLETLCRQDPGLGLELARRLAQSRALAFGRMTAIARYPARRRAALLLAELFFRVRGRWPDRDGEEMRLPITQEHIGEATGLSPEHVNRVLGALRRDTVLAFHHRRLTILDAQRLMAEASP